MFKTTMPIFEQIEQNGKLVTNRKEISVIIDTSIYSEQRWEIHFPHQAEKETLTAYVSRISNNKSNSTSYVLGCLKALFCFIKANEFPDFESFCQQFNLADQNSLNEITERINYIFNIALTSSAASPKN